MEERAVASLQEAIMHVHRFPDPAALARALAGEIKVDLDEAIATRGRASLVVSSGALEQNLFRTLSREALDWSKVWITLSDECWVDTQSSLSHEWQVRESLLQNAVHAAHFIGLKNPAATPEAGVDWATRALTRIPRPFDVVVLSLGVDGQIAGLCPNSLALARAADPAAAPGCVAVHALALPHARITLNLQALLDARSVLLLVHGEQGLQALDRAQRDGPYAEVPARLLLRQKGTPIELFWAPATG
jgi:6-phosphogluconolactonase